MARILRIIRERWLMLAIVALMAGGVAYLLAQRYNSVADVLSRVRLVDLLPLFVLGTFCPLLRAIRWHVVMDKFGYKQPALQSISLSMVSIGVSLYTPFKAGEGAKVLARDKQHSVMGVSVTVLAERVYDVIALLILGLVGFAGLAATGAETLGKGLNFGLLAIIVALGIAFILMVAFPSRLGKLLEWGVRVLRISGDRSALLSNLSKVKRPDILSWGTLITLVAWAFECATAIWIFHMLSIDASPLVPVTVQSFTMLAMLVLPVVGLGYILVIPFYSFYMVPLDEILSVMALEFAVFTLYQTFLGFAFLFALKFVRGSKTK